MGWIDVSEELIIEEVQLSDHAPILLYSHKFDLESILILIV